MRAKAELTVFFALIIAVVFALFLAVLESARTGAARLRLTIAANSAIDSLFSQYHRELWDEYRILGLEYYLPEQLSDEMEDFIKPYLEADNWMRMKLKNIEIDPLGPVLITDDDAEHFEEEILSYMKYGIIARIWDYADIEIFNEGAREGPNTELIAELYDDHAAEAQKIEEKIKEIVSAGAAAADYVEQAANAAGETYSEAAIERLEKAIEELKKIPDLIDKYESLADKLQKGLSSSREELNLRKASGDISEETWAYIDEDVSEYESYILADGERRQEILGLKSKSSSDITYLEGMIVKIQDVIEYIDNYSPQDEEDEGPDEEELFRPIEIELLSYEALGISGSYGVEDEETLSLIESFKEALSGGILSLVLPEGASLSSETYEMGEKPSEYCYEGYDEARLSLIDRVYAAEYMCAVSGYFGRGVYDDEKTVGTALCETEYLISGEQSDEGALGALAERLMLLRSGLNLIYLYKDSVKRSEARALAMSICGIAALTPLCTVVTFLIMSVWAAAQALIDIRTLLKGGKVPFIPTDKSFNLTVSGLIDMAGSGGKSESAQEGSSDGLSYDEYLKIFLFFSLNSETLYRMMDVIQMNLMKNQPDFMMERLIYSLDATISADAAHVFSEFGLIKHLGGSLGDYDMSVSTAYSY